MDGGQKTLGVFVVVASALLLITTLLFSGGGDTGSGDGPGTPGDERNGEQVPSDRPAGDGNEGSNGTATGEPRAAGDPGSRQNVDNSGDRGSQDAAPDDDITDPRGGGVPEGEVAIEDEEGRSNGQRGFVSSFIGGAYGYTGTDAGEYRNGYENRIDTSTYYDSPGGAELESYAALVQGDGAQNAAILEGYNILSGPPVAAELRVSEVEGLATGYASRILEEDFLSAASLARVEYAIGDRYGDPEKDEDFGEVYGGVDYYAQELVLVEDRDSGWVIMAGGPPESVEDPDADMPDRSAPKVAEPSGPGH